jgi:DNA-binding XRE family transcriptional regulator
MKKKLYLKNVEDDLRKELKNPEFRKAFEYEAAMVALAQKIAELRDASRIKQSDLAARLNVSQQFVSQIETGRAKNLTLQTLLKVAAALGRDVRITFPPSSRPTLKIH